MSGGSNQGTTRIHTDIRGNDEGGIRRNPQARACQECNRQKTKCDKRVPTCSRCFRTEQQCIYPKHRRRYQRSSNLTHRHSHLRGMSEEPSLANNFLDQLDTEQLQNALSRRIQRYSSQSSRPYQPATEADNFHGVRDWPPWTQALRTGQIDQPRQANAPSSADGEDLSNSLAPFSQPETTVSWLSEYLMTSNNEEILQEDTTMPTDLFSFQSETTNEDQPPLSPFVRTPLLAHDAHGEFSATMDIKYYSMSVPASVVDEMIDTFFDTIAHWIPLFHRPRFYEKYKVRGTSPDRYKFLELEDCLTLNGICLLAARFAKSPFYKGVRPKERTEPFLSNALILYQKAMNLDTLTPRLTLLQGMILVAWYHQSCGASGLCGLLIGICCRLAYDLELNCVDKDIVEGRVSAHALSSEEWSRRESLRRVWWLVWELDMFSATVNYIPHTIDKTQIDVLLPVSDVYYFSDTPHPSAPILRDPIQAWKSLQDSSNDDERAWFLVASFLRAVTHDLTSRPDTSEQVASDFQSSLTCFPLLLPKRFDIATNPLDFDEIGHARCNIVVACHLMIQSARSTFQLWCQKTYPLILDMSPEVAASEDQAITTRVLRRWEPNCIPYACPLVVATILGPSAKNARAACKLARDSEQKRPMYLAMMKLVLAKIAEYWEIGALISGLVQMIESRESDFEQLKHLNSNLRRFRLLLPQDATSTSQS